MIELPKWPALVVKGRRITQEQADKVIVRTSWLMGVDSEERKWNSELKKVFGIRHGERLWDTSYEEWESIAERLGVLDISYLTNSRIRSADASGPDGWCAWDGTIGCAGLSLMAKWPEVSDIHTEWRTIAHAFPFLDLTAQLARVEWSDKGDGRVSGHTPLVTWDVANGAVSLRDDPGPLLAPIRKGNETPEEFEQQIQRMMRRGSDIGVSARRLREAVRRCERAARKGK